MANVALSPSMSAKLKTKECVRKIKQGSPKLQEVLRERCRQRMREKRSQLFNRKRFGLEISYDDVQEKLTEIVRKEFNNLMTTDLDPLINPMSPINDAPLDPDEALQLEAEILNEEEQWIIEEYEKMSFAEEEFISLLEDKETYDICPMCQKASLSDVAKDISCTQCNFQLSAPITMKEFTGIMGECVNTHSANCKDPPGFAVIPEGNNSCLYMICRTCSMMMPVV